MSRILLSGASGFIGRPLFDRLLSKGHEVLRLARSGSKKEDGSIIWDPEGAKARKEDFEGFDAVIHLAGEPISLGRWSKLERKRILFSRTVGTLLLSQILSQLYSPPKVFLSASAVGFYGDRGEEILTEESDPGRGFLANVCCEWEKASYAIENRGSRTAHMRFGKVVGPKGKTCLPLGLGPKNRWISWIEREDLIRAVEHILDHDSLEGPINLVSPNPVQQKEFSQISIPPWALRLRYGLAADELLLSSTRAVPSKLLASEFIFQTPYLLNPLRKATQ